MVGYGAARLTHPAALRSENVIAREPRMIRDNRACGHAGTKLAQDRTGLPPIYRGLISIRGCIIAISKLAAPRN
jgi:hypothetical protein